MKWPGLPCLGGREGALLPGMAWLIIHLCPPFPHSHKYLDNFANQGRFGAGRLWPQQRLRSDHQYHLHSWRIHGLKCQQVQTDGRFVPIRSQHTQVVRQLVCGCSSVRPPALARMLSSGMFLENCGLGHRWVLMALVLGCAVVVLFCKLLEAPLGRLHQLKSACVDVIHMYSTV